MDVQIIFKLVVSIHFISNPLKRKKRQIFVVFSENSTVGDPNTLDPLLRINLEGSALIIENHASSITIMDISFPHVNINYYQINKTYIHKICTETYTNTLSSFET